MLAERANGGGADFSGSASWELSMRIRFPSPLSVLDAHCMQQGVSPSHIAGACACVDGCVYGTPPHSDLPCSSHLRSRHVFCKISGQNDLAVHRLSSSRSPPAPYQIGRPASALPWASLVHGVYGQSSCSGLWRGSISGVYRGTGNSLNKPGCLVQSW